MFRVDIMTQISIPDLCREFVLSHSAGNDASHDIYHIDRVVRNAKNIMKNSDAVTQANISHDILVTIATLHDSFDHKYFTSEEAIEKAKAKVVEFLGRKFSFEEVGLIMRVIENIGYTTEINGGSELSDNEMRYLHIVQDADRLDAMGAVGIGRCFAWAGAFGKTFVSSDKARECELREKFSRGELVASIAEPDDSAISIFYRKLLFLKNMLKTPVGRQMGERRHDFMMKYLEEYFTED